MPDYTPEFTPIQKLSGHLCKRDDLYEIAGIRGGKVRACHYLATHTPRPRTAGLLGTKPQAREPILVTASARKSPQMQIVARLAERLGMRCRCHTASGPHTEEMQDAAAHGATLVQHRPGYNSVIMARAEADVKDLRGIYIPFGMEHEDAMNCTRAQVASLVPYKRDIKRIVMVLGSGMSAAGIMWGLKDLDWFPPMLGIQIGAAPHRRLAKYAPAGWADMMRIEVSRHAYTTAVEANMGGVDLDPHYEGKVVEYLRPGDLFWIVGIRASLSAPEVDHERRTVA